MKEGRGDLQLITTFFDVVVYIHSSSPFHPTMRCISHPGINGRLKKKLVPLVIVSNSQDVYKKAFFRLVRRNQWKIRQGGGESIILQL